MRIPDWWAFALLALAAWRIFELIAHDTILDRPRRWALKLGADWEKEGDLVPDGFREKWALFIQCSHCCGFWVGVAWWGAWLIFPHATLVIAVPFALNAVVIALAKILASDE